VAKISELELLAVPAPEDTFEVLDVSDTSMAPTGTNKKVALGALVSVFVSTEAPVEAPSRDGLLWIVVPE